MVKVLAVTKVPENVELIGNAQGLVYISEEKYFLSAVGMMPGDKVNRSINIENQYEVPYELFLRAERVLPKQEYDLLAKMNLKITNGKVEYNGPIIIGNDELVELDLGLFNPGDKRVFNAEVELDGAITGNDYKNRAVEVNWIFTAEYRGSGFNPNEVPSNENKVVNNSGRTATKTQDNNSILLYCLLAGGSLLVIILGSKKLKESKEE